ncbi:hypothetical protein HDV00_011271 [Rhizophlyctis rosea]|nr:hypothetical protein HDV00_011271 [Rhizophlyctis rosea]
MSLYLPDDILRIIFTHLPPSTLLSSALLCTHWHTPALDTLHKTLRPRGQSAKHTYIKYLLSLQPALSSSSAIQIRTFRLLRTLNLSAVPFITRCGNGAEREGGIVFDEEIHFLSLKLLPAVLSNITSLTLSSVDISFALHLLAHTKRLKHLSLIKCHSLTKDNAALSNLMDSAAHSLENLTSFSLSTCGGTLSNPASQCSHAGNVVYEALAPMLGEKLRTLELGPFAWTGSQSQMTHLSATCPNLQNLHLANAPLPSTHNTSFFTSFTTWTRLRVLDFSYYSDITDRHIIHISRRCPHITHLNLQTITYTQITSASISALNTNLPPNQLVALLLQPSSPIPDTTLIFLLKSHPTLKSLSLPRSATGAPLVAAAVCNQLEYLSLSVPGEGVARFIKERCGRLRGLKVVGVKEGERGVVGGWLGGGGREGCVVDVGDGRLVWRGFELRREG